MQPSLFHESINDALREVVQALGGTKKVGLAMRPEKSADEAGRWLSDCLNPDRREKLDPDQVLFLLKEGRGINCHSAMNFICCGAGYSDPVPVEPQDKMAALQREYIEMAKKLLQTADQINQLSVPRK